MNIQWLFLPLSSELRVPDLALFWSLSRTFCNQQKILTQLERQYGLSSVFCCTHQSIVPNTFIFCRTHVEEINAQNPKHCCLTHEVKSHFWYKRTQSAEHSVDDYFCSHIKAIHIQSEGCSEATRGALGLSIWHWCSLRKSGQGFPDQ